MLTENPAAQTESPNGESAIGSKPLARRVPQTHAKPYQSPQWKHLETIRTLRRKRETWAVIALHLEYAHGPKVIRESNTHTDARLKLVDDLIEEFKAGHKVMVVAPVHRDGRKVADSLRAAMSMEGFLGQKERQIAWLESANLSSVQQMDPIHYEPGQLIEFCRRAKGEFKSGERWTVSRKERERVFVTRDGKEKVLPLQQWKTFNVYRTDTMPLAVGEHLLITKNNRVANLRNGELRKVAAIDGDRITLDNGRQLNSSRPLHIRQAFKVRKAARFMSTNSSATALRAMPPSVH